MSTSSSRNFIGAMDSSLNARLRLLDENASASASCNWLNCRGPQALAERWLLATAVAAFTSFAQATSVIAKSNLALARSSFQNSKAMLSKHHRTAF
ncbi:hypothetical protein F0160_06300 [Paraburkholderia sp. JPY303]|uniref:hypothetical protein n=1 Tax=Paraburkholderia atlantica TaxID=2654982 RepID=UPI001592A9C2|nr:hypothetical protein [Paraburkholderia atlantica]NUY30130.1 hypothetical protein [Paraburkholderia atlantica]